MGRFAALSLLGLWLAACGTDNSISTRKAAEKLHPDAGEDQVVLPGETVTLDGSGSGGPGNALIYEWESLSQRIELDDMRSPIAHFSTTEAGVYPFLLWVTAKAFDDTWVSSHVVVTVRESGNPPSDLDVMVSVPRGYTVLGIQQGSVMDARFAGEAPGTVVYVDAFEIDRYEVTNKAYREFLDAEPRAHDFGQVPDFGGDLQPVVGATWDDARDYCAWRGKRLPTECEWERAARAFDAGAVSTRFNQTASRYRRAYDGAADLMALQETGAGDTFKEDVVAMLDELVAQAESRALYPWGGERPDAAQVNFGGDVSGNVRRTVPVGSYPLGKGRLGVHDMAGNVWEWTADWYDEALYATLRKDLEKKLTKMVSNVEKAKRGGKSMPDLSPDDLLTGNPEGAEPRDTVTAGRTIRGGSWIDDAMGVRSTMRGTARESTRTNHIGFRCAR